MEEQFFYNDDKSIVLILKTDGSEAYLKLSERCLFFDEEEVCSIINNAGIKHGFENARHYQAENELSKQLGKPFLIAKHTPAKEPEFNYHFHIDHKNMLNPSFKEKPDLDNISNNEFVEVGRQLASLDITGEGIPGKDIFGKEIVPPEDEQSLAGNLCGEGVEFKEGRFISKRRGFPLIDDHNRLSVIPVLAFEADINMDLNRYYSLPCTIFVNGNIAGEGYLEVDGDISVSGDVKKSSLHASGKIIINGLAERAVLMADQSLHINRALRSRICAGTDLVINDSALKSLLFAGESVMGNEAKCNCLDCSVYASKSLIVGSFTLVDNKKGFLILCYAPYLKELLAYYKYLIAKNEKGQLNNTELASIKTAAAEVQHKILLSYPEKQDKDGAEEGQHIDYGSCSVTVLRLVSKGTEVRIYNRFIFNVKW